MRTILRTKFGSTKDHTALKRACRMKTPLYLRCGTASITAGPWLAKPKRRTVPWIAGDVMTCRRRRLVAECCLQGENIHPAANCMSRMGVPATMGMEPDVCLPAPHRHASGHRLTGQWAIPFITWKEPVPRLAAAQRLEQLQRVGADADGAGFAPLAQ